MKRYERKWKRICLKRQLHVQKAADEEKRTQDTNLSERHTPSISTE